MALKILNPGTRPLGQFDLIDQDAGQILGGEYVEIRSVSSAERFAADVAQYTDPGNPGNTICFQRSSRTMPHVGGLADEGVEGYGTLFGSITANHINGSAIVLGPSTDRASGKVTVWVQQGLYGIAGAAAVNLTGIATNTELYADSSTGLLSDVSGGPSDTWVATMIGSTSDTSLVSTTNSAVGGTPVVEYYAVYLAGFAAYDY